MTWRSRPSLTAAPSPTVEAALVSAVPPPLSYVVAHGGSRGGWRSEPMALAAARKEAQHLMGEGRWLSSVARPLLGEIEVWHEEGGERWLCILATGRESEGR